MRKPKQIIAEQNKQAERDLAQKQVQPVAVVEQEPIAMVGDGWNDTDGADERVIQGTMIKCVDGHWTDRDKQPIPAGTRLLALATHTLLQRWQDDRPIDTIPKKPGQPLPDVDKLNEKIPQKEWETGLDGKPRPPWQKQWLVYLLDGTSAERFTFINSTFGARIAVDNLKDQVKWMRAMRGAHVFPLVELSSAPMKTDWGTKSRPAFRVVEWRQLGNGEGGPAVLEPAAVPAIGKPVPRVTGGEALDDEIPF